MTLVVRALPLTNNIALLVAVSAPFAVVLAAVGLVLSVLGRHIVMSVIAVVVVAATLGVQIRWYYSGQSQPAVSEHVELRVLSSNLRKGPPIWRPSRTWLEPAPTSSRCPS
ncbi:MAG: hypothetical protein WA944_23910 [Mycobacterium sp.]